VTLPPRIVVLSAPSGGGKTTIAKAVRDQFPKRFGFSVSATTRKPRPVEKDGVDYHFWPRRQFEEQVRAGKFLEHAEYAGELYGTLKDEVEKVLAAGLGRHVLLDIEVEGARQVRAQYPEPRSVSIFILPSDPRVLLQRLRGRRSESPEQIRRRLDRARYELAQATQFDCLIRNDDLDTAVRDVVNIAEGTRQACWDAKDRDWVAKYGASLHDELQQQRG
jgi:guanylate kinase